MASLVQDLWLGREPRLRGRRLAPWEEPRVRLLLHLDAGHALEDPAVSALLEALGARLEVVTWEPRRQAAGQGPGPEVLDDLRRLATDGTARWSALPLVLGGLGLGGWIALAAASVPGVRGAFAVAPSLAGAGVEAASPLRSALRAALDRAPLEIPLLVLEGRDRAPAEAEAVAQWLAREPRASRLVGASGDAGLLAAPWPAVLAAWTEAVGAAR